MQDWIYLAQCTGNGHCHGDCTSVSCPLYALYSEFTNILFHFELCDFVSCCMCMNIFGWMNLSQLWVACCLECCYVY